MKISEEQKGTIESELVAKYCENGFELYNGWNGLYSMIINDFLDNIEEYDENCYLEDMVNDICGNANGSYTCSTYESAKLIAENIFEFNEIVEEIENNWGTPLNAVDTERNLVMVLLYICQQTILSQDCETLGELVEKLS